MLIRLGNPRPIGNPRGYPEILAHHPRYYNRMVGRYIRLEFSIRFIPCYTSTRSRTRVTFFEDFAPRVEGHTSTYHPQVSILNELGATPRRRESNGPEDIGPRSRDRCGSERSARVLVRSAGKQSRMLQPSHIPRR